MSILWLMDRFGMPGHYHRVWVRLLRDSYVPVDEVRVISLHKVLAPRTLLTKLANRKAPTWVPEEGPTITAAIDQLIRQFKPRAVVLAAPESLACLGLNPEHATLHNLRGSVYWRSGVPHLVMLPMSAWFSLVSQKEIGAANYGFESQDTFTAARTEGPIHLEGRSAEAGGKPGSDERFPPLLGTRLQSDRTAGSNPADKDLVGGFGRRPDSRSPHVVGLAGALSGTHSQPNDSGHVSGSGNGSTADESDAAEQSGAEIEAQLYRDSARRASGFGAPEGDDDSDLGESDGGDGVLHAGEGRDGGTEGDSEDADAESSGGELNDPDAGDVDQFFYEPVLSPVGRFVLTADVGKLSRIIRDGKNAAGPAHPIQVNWR